MREIEDMKLHHFRACFVGWCRCDLGDILLEFDRILRPGGYIIAREKQRHALTLQAVVKALHWDTVKSFREGDQILMSLRKGSWRPLA